MARRCCICSCHQEARGNYKDAQQRADYAAVVLLARVETVNTTVPVDADDALEAAVACRLCVNNHCPALLSRYIPDPNAWTDPPIHPPPAEAAGQGDGDDGN